MSVAQFEDRSLDFCNSFWGPGDAGYEVLTSRMRIAMKTIEDLRNFWRERAAIEDDYAKRLVRLSKQPLGQGEIGELKNSLDVLRQETERQAGQHLSLAISIRKELEAPANEFLAKQAHHKKTYQNSIEKTYKAKQMNEGYVAKARDRYEQDCHRINSFTAQQSLVQGRELDKVTIKLERAQGTIEANKRDYQNFTLALAETVSRWDKEWKDFCDRCQDLEEDRIEFLKDNVWAYANAVSTVCVHEDESCESIRLSLERLDVPKDIETFITNHGTGSAIPEAPPFINYSSPEPTPARPPVRQANFERSSTRPQSIMSPAISQVQREEEPVDAGEAGVGAKHARGASGSYIGTQETGAGSILSHQAPPTLPPSSMQGGPAPGMGYHTQTGSISSIHSGSPYGQPTLPPSSSISNDRRTSYQAGPNSSADPGTYDFAKSAHIQPGAPNDPLEQQLQLLRGGGGGGDSVHRGNSTRAPASTHQATNSVQSNSHRAVSPAPAPAPAALSPPTSSAVDYSESANAIVGQHPASRPSSPALSVAPHPAMMQPGGVRAPSPVEKVVAEYGQAFPGERRRSGSINTQNHQRGRTENSAPGQRSVSPGYAGVGANGRSPSPQPFKRLASPGPGNPQQSQQVNLGQQYNHVSPPPNADRRGASPALQPATGSVRRAASPAGISLDATGQVSHDSLARDPQLNNYGRSAATPIAAPVPTPMNQPGPNYAYYNQSPAQPQQQQQQQVVAPMQGPPSMHMGQQSNFVAPPPPPMNQQQVYNMYQQPVQPVHNPMGSQGSLSQYGVSQQAQYQPSQQQQQLQQQQQPPPPPVANNQPAMYAQPGYGMPMQNASNYAQQQLQQQQPQQQQQQPPQQHQGQHMQMGVGMMPPNQAQQPPSNPVSVAPTQGNRESPTPPTGNYIEDRGILFYVKALYDYTATIDEEFSFQAGDVIAVLATPDDGWWQGILLDDSRRQPGRTVFPSNFVCLF